ncbi:MAG: glycosyltransferase family 2 protein [Mobilitalea sp.]
MIKLAGVVVLYHPSEKTIQNINTYIKDVDILYAVDNSVKKDEKIISEIKAINKVVYLDNKGNRGIAHAQNRAAHKAIKENYEWMLTMDQDSSATENMISLLSEYIEMHDTSKVGIVTAYQKPAHEIKNYFLRDYQQVLVAMSSGNILNLKAYQVVGGLLNKLFIDMVDNEYCLRLNQNGYRVIMVNKAILNHNLGEIKIVDQLIFSSHSPLRLYYYVRNDLYVTQTYKEQFPNWIKDKGDIVRRKYIRTLLYDKNKLENLYYMLRAYIDFKRNRFGKFK